jgi:FMN-dependent NADH-azoreductase
MPTLLHLDSSARRMDNAVAEYNSISKTLAGSFIQQWQGQRPNDPVIYRDLGKTPPDFVCQDWIAAVFTDEENRTDAQERLLMLSDTLIDELNKADIILMSTPMYNYGMPAALKAWFDQVIRINKTFTFDLGRGDFPLKPLMSGKTLVLVSSSGEFGFEVGGIREAMNHLGPHIEVLGKYLGVEHFHEISAQYQEFADHRHKQSVGKAHSAAIELAGHLADAYR